MRTMGYFVSGVPTQDAVTSAQAAYDHSRMVGSNIDAQGQYELLVKLNNAKKAHEAFLLTNPPTNMKNLYIYGGVALSLVLFLLILKNK